MPISFEENVAQLEAYMANARNGAAAVANAMARYIAERAAQDTLTRNKHAPGAYHRARPGAPPSYASGTLANAMFWTPASGDLRATAMVGNSEKRARVFEFGGKGCVLKPTDGTHLGWKDTGRKDNPSGIWRHRQVEQPEHPFLGPTTDEAIDDGELRRVAIEAGRPYDP
jgi:hypothetical protein